MADPSPTPSSSPAPTRRRLTVVYNPVKVDDVDHARGVVAQAASRHGWETPTWIETTEQETGEKQAREAVEGGADVVASMGGDGTVRAVATALVGTDVALGLLPAGTGNLLARNLGLPIDTLEEAAEALVSGGERRVDVGAVRLGESERVSPGTSSGIEDGEEVFLVMCGLGLDGEVMAGTNEKIKGVIGWPAYILSGLKSLGRRGFRADVRATGGAAQGSQTPGAQTDTGVVGRQGNDTSKHARMVVVGNCGTLQGGLELMPDARIDDGVLDAVVIAPRGAFGWASVVSDIVTRHHAGHRRLDRLRGAVLEARVREGVEAEVDGDPVGPRTSLAARVLPGALVVRSG
ncbi:diacylglycerol/lipid kinase family protein [Intrasporangium sp. YIM S08009]|uniref:diacylglycerol/lipid kinase family protein n=1 Tax=Intrasporangium zincisolvens TaxID=3080018 RepID=UPI002B060E91|nr:diacylglycerol kinase family protein [Intrasporangium sp. YIM S08009]